MPLTPADVRGVQFATTRWRTGYEMDEVDAFLDIIEADISQLTDELQRSRDGEAVLRTQCDQLQQRLVALEARLADCESASSTQTGSSTQTALSAAPPSPQVTEELAVALAEHQDAAAVLAVAQRTADEIIRFAQQRADAIRASVRGMLDDQRALLDRD